MRIDDRPTHRRPRRRSVSVAGGDRRRARARFRRAAEPADAGKIRRRRICARSRHAGGDLRPAGQHSLCHAARRAALQSLEGCATIRAASGGERRSRNFASPNPEWETLLDIDRLAAEEGKDWLLGWTADAVRGADSRAILSLSRGGSDAVTLREFDLDTKSFVADGFALPEAKGGAEWVDADTLLLSSALWRGHGDDFRLRANRPAVAARRADVDQAPVIFEAPPDRMARVLRRRPTPAPTPRIWFIDRLDFFNLNLWLGDETGAKSKLDLPTDIWMEAHQRLARVKLRTAWTVGGQDLRRRTPCSAFRCRPFSPATAISPSSSSRARGARCRAFSGPPASWCCRSSTNCGRCSRSARRRQTAGRRERLRGLPEIGVVDVWRLDRHESESNGDLLANVQDPLTPPSLMLIEGVESPTVLKQAPKTFTADGLVVTQHEAISIDGERIPYVQTGPAAETGDAPVYMSAYGGFGLAVKPYYNSALGKLWLERGGTMVQANIRGGGEFGTRWHDAGRYAGKRLAHDDFAAVAADLVRRGVTRAERIAAEGGSNGGILISNMLVRYPERFGALFCTIPLIDMRRYTKLLAGASWIAEYGDPDKPEEWAWLQTYSAYHTAKPGQKYPPILIATTRRDDRVHPGHARKMAAKLQAMGYEAWFYEPAAGGHGYGKDNKERAAFMALGYTFLKDKIGWPDGGA